MPPEIGIGSVLGQLSHEVLVQHCFSSGLRLNDHTSNLFLTIVITSDTTQSIPTSIIHHLCSCHFLWFYILCATEFQGAHLPRSHVNLSAFLKHYITYLQDNERIKLCGVAHAFVQISENGRRSKKFGHPCCSPSERLILVDYGIYFSRFVPSFLRPVSSPLDLSKLLHL